MKFEHIFPFIKLLLDSVPILYSHSSVCCTFLDYLIQLELSTKSSVCGHPLEHAWPFRDPTFKGNWLFISQQLSIVNSTSTQLLSQCWSSFWLNLLRFCACCHDTTSSYGRQPSCDQKILFPCSHTLPPTIAFFLFLQQCSLNLQRRVMIYN